MMRDGETIHMLSGEVYAGLEKEGDSRLPPSGIFTFEF
jgi:hypothetical protein